MLTKPLLPGVPSGRSRGHSLTSKQARSPVGPSSTCRQENYVAAREKDSCHRGGESSISQGMNGSEGA